MEIQLIDEGTVARKIGCKVKTLQAWRCRGVGPEFSKIGRLVRYDPRKLEAWVKSRSARSTSELPRDEA